MPVESQAPRSLARVSRIWCSAVVLLFLLSCAHIEIYIPHPPVFHQVERVLIPAQQLHLLEIFPVTPFEMESCTVLLPFGSQSLLPKLPRRCLATPLPKLLTPLLKFPQSFFTHRRSNIPQTRLEILHSNRSNLLGFHMQEQFS